MNVKTGPLLRLSALALLLSACSNDGASEAQASQAAEPEVNASHTLAQSVAETPELSNFGQASEVARLRMPGYPRDLVLIPNYGFQRRPDTVAETKDLLAIVGGDIHGSADSANHYLRIVDISDPTNPTRIASTTVSFAGSSAVTRVRWSPPYVGFLEIGGAYSVSQLVWLTELRRGGSS